MIGAAITVTMIAITTNSQVSEESLRFFSTDSYYLSAQLRSHHESFTLPLPFHPLPDCHTALSGRATTSTRSTSAQHKLAKSKIGKDGFKFKVARGVVTWEGSTNVVQHKGSATRMAKAAGAVQVVNNIQVSAAAKAKAAAGLKKAYVQQ